MSPPPMPDFAVIASPVSASAVVGNTSSVVTISVAPKNGFTGSVKITLSGLPSGVTASPGSFPIQAGSRQTVSFAIADSAPIGVFQVKVAGVSPSTSHTAQILLTTEPVVTVRTYQSGSMLFLESDSGSDISRIGLQTLWGGSIVEVSLNGTNFVNEHDTGREVQVAEWDGAARYDSCAPLCTGTYGWNPVQGGDFWDDGSPVLAQSVNPDSLYIKAQPIQWNPDDKSGGPGQPVLGDVYDEATITAVTNHAFTFKVHYKLTHFGSDQHANAIQEFPAVYVNLGYDRFFSDTSTAPWTNSALTPITMPQLPAMSPTLYASEQWGAYVDTKGNGLTVFVPGMAPYVAGFAAAGDPGPLGFGTYYFAPRTFFSFGPNTILEGDVYLVAGDQKHARQVIYDLHNTLTKADISAPIGSLDTPIANQQLSGKTSVTGWAFDNTAVSKVDIYVDGLLAGSATYGGSRPDVANDWPHAPADIGFSFSLDTTRYANGLHVLEIRATDVNSNVAIFPDVPITIQN
jgi:hypothetical protein